MKRAPSRPTPMLLQMNRHHHHQFSVPLTVVLLLSLATVCTVSPIAVRGAPSGRTWEPADLQGVRGEAILGAMHAWVDGELAIPPDETSLSAVGQDEADLTVYLVRVRHAPSNEDTWWTVHIVDGVPPTVQTGASSVQLTDPEPMAGEQWNRDYDRVASAVRRATMDALPE